VPPTPSSTATPNAPQRILITAGPTHEPIDAVRYIANRSSGRLGISLAETAADRGWSVTLLLGPTPRSTTHSAVRLRRFQSTADLEALLVEELPGCDVLVMAAAVADYRPRPPATPIAQTKLKRVQQTLTLELEPTPDLLAGCAARRRPGQQLIGFALEPRDRLMESALSKLERKKVDMIVANPLETMDAEFIDATLVARDGRTWNTGGSVDKDQFAPWLLDRIAEYTRQIDATRPSPKR
jgi:phosphopantothenoylcysteine decarboxylase/phosphopantothenate--cysteine ligase